MRRIVPGSTDDRRTRRGDTPRLAVAAAGQPWAGAISRLDAAEALDVTAGTVQQLVARGALARHPDGGLQLATVLARLVRLRG